MTEFEQLAERERKRNRRLVPFRVERDSFHYGEDGMYPFSEDFKDSMEHYLINGLEPGGFATAMLAGDLERALYNADTYNRQVFWAIAMWVRETCPPQATGSYEAVEAWCANKDGRRDRYKDELEKAFAWKQLEQK